MAEADVLDAYCAWADGSGFPEAEAEAGEALAALLRHGPAARRALVEYALLDAALYRVFLVPPPPLPWWRKPLGPGGWVGGVVLMLGVIGGAIAWQNRPDSTAAVNNVEEPPRVVASLVGLVDVGGKPSTNVLTSTDIVVAPNAPATIRLRDGSTILLHPGSRLRMRRLDDVDRGFEFNFLRGGADFRLVPGHRDLRVVTPFGSVVASGPNFTVSVDPVRRRIQYEGPLRLYAGPLPDPGR